MTVDKRYTGDITLLKVEGDLAGPNAEEFRELAGQCPEEGRRDFIVDLGDANTCDSTGLEALTWLQQECHDHLGLVKLAGINENIRKILEMTRLNQRFEDDYDTF